MPRPQPMQCNAHAPEQRRHLVVLHSAPARRRNDHRGHEAAAQLGPESVAGDKGDAAPERGEVVPFYREEWGAV